jgi:CDP-paratose 2-epimerase
MKSIFITGGAGFIGVNAALHFLAKGWNVIVLDNLSRRGSELNLRTLEAKKSSALRFVKGDIRTDIDLLGTLMEECDVVLHLAAQVAVTTSVVNPREDFDINALGTFNLLEAVRISKRRPALLYASTNKVYGSLDQVGVVEQEHRYAFAGGIKGITEKEPLDFHSPYGCSKGAADQYVRDYARLYSMKTVVLRQSCIYGQNQFGIEDQGWVAWFLIAAMMGRPVTIYGNGKQVRDLLFIDDLVACYDAAIAKIDTIGGEVYNLGGGPDNTLSLREFLDLIRTQHDLDIRWSQGDTRPGDQPMFVSDNTKAYTELGWAPKTNVQDGIKKLHDWLTGNLADVRTFYT